MRVPLPLCFGYGFVAATVVDELEVTLDDVFFMTFFIFRWAVVSVK